MSRESTNLAGEFHVLSVLHRLGANAHLTLGHHKAVDIVIVRDNASVKTVDVKAAATQDWFVDNLPPPTKSHFIVFVAYTQKIADVAHQPEIYVVPSTHIGKQLTLYKSPKGKKVIRLKDLRNKTAQYRDKWNKLL